MKGSRYFARLVFFNPVADGREILRLTDGNATAEIEQRVFDRTQNQLAGSLKERELIAGFESQGIS